MLRRRTAATAAAAVGLTLLLAGAVYGQPGGPVSRPLQDGACAPASKGGHAPAAHGQAGLAAVEGTTAVLVGTDHTTRTLPVAAIRGVARQVARHPSRGVAMVDDLAGADRIAITGPAGSRALLGGGEVSDLTWTPRGELAWAVNARSLRVADVDGRSVRAIAPPAGTLGAYAPAFTRPDQLVAVIEEAPPAASRLPASESTVLNNLWSYDLAAGTWTRLTSFSVAGSVWSAIRTPLVAPGGDVLFVRVSGDAQRTELPTFTQWRLHRGSARAERILPADTVLAGWLGSELIVNRLDARRGTWQLLRSSGAGFTPIGCGSVLVASIASDPDASAEATAPVAPTPAIEEPELAVAIGDFESPAAAAAARARLADGAAWTVAGHQDAPYAVRPGAWVLLQPIRPGEQPGAQLQRVRAAHPELEERSFVVPAGR